MGYEGIIKVMRLLPFVLAITSASVCPPGDKYWSSSLETCVNCTRCDLQVHVVLRPCEVHRDTVCGTLNDLQIDLGWMGHHTRHHGRHHKKRKEDVRNNGDVEVTSTELAFSSTEKLVWDWQAVALTSAVFACLLFFLVAALYSIHQARQWKRLKDNFEADVEELSAKLNMMASGELADTLEPSTQPITDGNYINNHCVYLEQLLVRKDAKIGPGNVYIEESNTNTMTKQST